MAIELKLATDDTPEPWQAAEAPALEALPAAELEYAREGLPSAQPKAWWRTLLAIARRIGVVIGFAISGLLYAVAMVLLGAGIVASYFLMGLAKLLLLIREGSPRKAYHRLRWGRVIDAELA